MGFVDTILARPIDFDTTPLGDQTNMGPNIGQQVAARPLLA